MSYNPVVKAIAQIVMSDFISIRMIFCLHRNKIRFYSIILLTIESHTCITSKILLLFLYPLDWPRGSSSCSWLGQFWQDDNSQEGEINWWFSQSRYHWMLPRKTFYVSVKLTILPFYQSSISFVIQFLSMIFHFSNMFPIYFIPTKNASNLQVLENYYVEEVRPRCLRICFNEKDN